MYNEKLILSSFVSSVFLLVSPVQASSSSQPACLDSFCCCIFFFSHSGSTLMEPFSVLFTRRLPYFTEKKFKWDCSKSSFNMMHPNAQYEESSSSTISTYNSDFYFPESCRMRFQTLPRLFSRHNSIAINQPVSALEHELQKIQRRQIVKSVKMFLQVGSSWRPL